MIIFKKRATSTKLKIFSIIKQKQKQTDRQREWLVREIYANGILLTPS